MVSDHLNLWYNNVFVVIYYIGYILMNNVVLAVDSSPVFMRLGVVLLGDVYYIYSKISGSFWGGKSANFGFDVIC